MNRWIVALLALLAGTGDAPLASKAWADAFSSTPPPLPTNPVGGLVVTIPTAAVSGANFQPARDIPVAANGQSEAINYIDTVLNPASSTASWIFSGWHHNTIFTSTGSWANWLSGDGLSIWNNLEIPGPGVAIINTNTTALSTASTTITMPTAGVIVGMGIVGTGIPAFTTVVSITDAANLVVSAVSTVASGAAVSANVDLVLQAKSQQNGIQMDGTGGQSVNLAWGHFNHHQVSNANARITTLYGYDTILTPMTGNISNYVDYNCQNFTGQAFTHPISNMWCLYNQDVNKRIYTNGRLIATGNTTVANLALGLAADTAFTAQRPILMSGIAPTITTPFGTGDTIPNSNGSAYFTVLVGTTPGGTAVITPGVTATNGWDCEAQDYTSNATVVIGQSARSTTTATLKAYSRTTGAASAPNASDVIGVRCLAD